VIHLIYWRDTTTTLHVGDAHRVLTSLPAGSADCVVTSPPYWAKRDYGVSGQYGLEPDPVGYVETLRAVFHVPTGSGLIRRRSGSRLTAGTPGYIGWSQYIRRMARSFSAPEFIVLLSAAALARA